jgi:hypothetical protein
MSLRHEHELELGRRKVKDTRSPENLQTFPLILVSGLPSGVDSEARAIQPAFEESRLKCCFRWTTPGVADALERGQSSEPGIHERVLDRRHARSPRCPRVVCTHTQLDERGFRSIRDSQGDESGSDEPAAAVFRDESPKHQPVAGERGPRLPPTGADDERSVGNGGDGGFRLSCAPEDPGACDTGRFLDSFLRQGRRSQGFGSD